MTFGFLMLVGSGLVWTITGAMISQLARHRIATVSLLAPQMLLSCLWALLLLPDYGHLRADMLPLVLLIGVAGMLNAGGVLILAEGMRRGHNGMVWTIGQSALVLPFLVGAICFHEPLTPGRVLGVAGILASLVAFGTARQVSPANVAQASLRGGFALAVIALFVFGSAQTLMTLPSRLPALADPAQIRIPVLYLGHAVVYLAVWLRRRQRPSGRILLSASLLSVLALANTCLLFLGLDRLGQAGMAFVAFPVAVGACIVFFALYSIHGLREPFTRRHAFGLAFGLCGVLSIALWR